MIDTEAIETLRNSMSKIDEWAKFSVQVRVNARPLLSRLNDFPRAILISGCQRSGTTMLSRIITESDGMVNYWFGPDDELSAALILSGAVSYTNAGRHCFQTTYLDERFREFYTNLRSDQRLIWVIRNPYSVVRSLLYNWPAYALDDTFQRIGLPMAKRRVRYRHYLLKRNQISKLEQACYVYQAKLQQLLELHSNLPKQSLFAVDYDELVLHKEILLPEIYRFINLPYHDAYADKIHENSLKKSIELTDTERSTIRSMCEAIYDKAAKDLLSSKVNAH